MFMLARGFWFNVKNSSELVMRRWILSACSANQEVPYKDHYGLQGLSSSAFVRCLRHSPPYRWNAVRLVSSSRDQMKWMADENGGPLSEMTC